MNPRKSEYGSETLKSDCEYISTRYQAGAPATIALTDVVKISGVKYKWQLGH